eukprot:TRINITY_DN32732_c0_g1_i1.p1 TRINITY_DN32732_c0_g1~~TRINITY_DN32732_c0_g1_i1.p1  ORF type:complete len:217 (+),score=35.03 TRINITY_DN32732_c0_g1_i1:12-662(+)
MFYASYSYHSMFRYLFFFFKQKTAYEMLRSLVGSEMCIRDRSIDVASRPHPRMLGRALAQQFREGVDPTTKEDAADINTAVYSGVIAAASSSVRAAAHLSDRKGCLESVASNIAVSVDLWARTEELISTSTEEPQRKQSRVEKPSLTVSSNTSGGGGESLLRPVEMLRHCKYLFGTGKARRCLLYTSDAADEEDSVDLGGRRIIKKKKNTTIHIFT